MATDADEDIELAFRPMITNGDPALLGATPLEGGCNFALYASEAERIELCLFDTNGNEYARHDLPAVHRGVWHGLVPSVSAGTGYGFRVHGAWDPAQGLRHNPAKLLVDPYARQLRGEYQWHEDVFGHDANDPMTTNDNDSAAFVPKSVVTSQQASIHRHPLIAWKDSIIYEANVRGFTMHHPALSSSERGRFAGLSNGQIIEYLKALGITAIELLPVHAFIDEHFLVQRGLRNAWGYNSLNFFSPMQRYAGEDPIREFREMVQALHDANIEVILDVVYNHTAEGDQNGPTLSFRGIDNRSYYRLPSDTRDHYINDTGTGNTINADHPVVQDLIIDSLRYWYSSMGVDGFRFDLAPILGRHAGGFSSRHPLLARIANDRALKHAKLIAEPWDIGPGGYQLGGFPPGWAEWNDRYRDTTRQFWRGDERQAPAMARRLHGSADIFEASGRPPQASINFVASHDGFTTRDVVSYESPHNLANGEDNRDGHQHNYSANYGVEGDSDDPAVNALRRRQQLNLIATLLLSQGTPMLLAGDEISNSQSGNNNAYAQDNEVSWIDWQNADHTMREDVASFIALRRETPLLRQRRYRHGLRSNALGWKNIEWLSPDGAVLHGVEWHHATAMTMLLCATDSDNPVSAQHGFAVLQNPTSRDIVFTLPKIADDGRWQIKRATGAANAIKEDTILVQARSLTCLSCEPTVGAG
ncbi:MAG: glycogen debranching protein GlgX [Pseudomonadota bacterium]